MCVIQYSDDGCEMSRQSKPKVLILATSYAPELRRPELRPKEYPRTDYVELSKKLDCEILDYAIYDKPGLVSRYRKYEKKCRLDFHLAMRGYKKAKNFDVVLLMSEQIAIPYMMIQKIFGKRAATVFISAQSSAKQALFVRSLRLLNELDIAITFTNAQRDFLTNEMLIPKDRVRCVLYAVDQNFYIPGKSEDYILTSGISGRDFNTFFRAVENLPVKVKFASGGRLYCPRQYTQFQAIPNNIEILSRTDNAGMRELYQKATLVVVPLHRSRQDAAGCSVALEAMCCGCPVIASNTEGMQDYITNGITGILVKPNDPIALKEAIMKLYGSSSMQNDLSIKARNECEKRLSLDSLVSGLLSAVEDAVSYNWI